MNIAVNDSYIYKYLDQQHQRDKERTRAEMIKNQKEQIPFLLAKYAGIGLIILCIGLGIKFANSYSKSNINENISSHSSAIEQAAEEDNLIDVERILESKNAFSEQSYEVPANTVTNYVIFDHVTFDKDGFNKITTGRQYEDPSKDAEHGWCYIERDISRESSYTFTLKRLDTEELVTPEITQSTAESLDTSIDTLKEARELCTF